MTRSAENEITELLQAWRRGDESALEKLTPQVYRELHRAAKGCMRDERDGHTLQTTALINELYLRLTDLKEIDWQNRAHFFALCARQMRRILTDQARARQSHKRGSGAQPVLLDLALVVAPEPSPASSGRGGRTQEPSRRDAVLWRPERGGNRGGVEGFTRNCDAGLETRESL